MPRQQYGGITDFGGTGKTIILLHGFLASSKYWQKLQPYLSRSGYRVITIDLLGFGRAPKPSESSYSYDEHVTYVHRAITRLKLNEPYIMVGHSMGALIAARYEALHSSEITSLILLHPPLYKDRNEAYATLRRTGKLYRFLLDSRFRRLGWMLIKTICFEYIGKHSRAARERSMRNVIEKAEILTDLRRTDSKTLLLVGLRDREEYLHNLNTYQLSTAIIARTEDVTHHSPIQSTQLVYQTIHRFVTSTT